MVNKRGKKISLTKEEFLMIASYFSFQAREDPEKEKLRFEKVNKIITKYLIRNELYNFQNNREDQFLKE